MPTADWGKIQPFGGTSFLHHTNYLKKRIQQIYIGCRKIYIKAQPLPTQTIFDQRMSGVKWRKQLLEATNTHLNTAKWMSRKTALLSAEIGCSVPRRLCCERKKMRVKRNPLQSCYSSYSVSCWWPWPCTHYSICFTALVWTLVIIARHRWLH